MKIFVSYPSEERSIAERLNLALLGHGHDVFFDRADLPPGLEYDQAITRALETSDLFIFLITPGAVAAGRYTLTELKLAEERWPVPGGRVLPVMLRATDMALVPSYLRAVNVLIPTGDAVAETAHEVQRLVRSRRLTTRAWNRVRSRSGVILLGCIALVGAAVWIGRLWDNDILGGAFTRLPADVRQRARGAAAMVDSGFVIATANPAQLLRFSERGKQVGLPIDIMGDPVALERTPAQLMIVTRAPDGVMVFDAKKLRVVDSTLLDPTLVRKPYGIADPPRRSGDIQSVAAGRGGLWVTTGDRDGEPTVLRFRLDRVWDVPTFTVDSAGFGRDAMGVRLRNIKGELWGARMRGNPSSLYHLVGFIRIDRFRGRDLKLVSCAHDVAESPAGNPLILSCDNELQEVYSEGNGLRLVGTRPTLPPERLPRSSTYDILATDSSRVIVALNTEATEPNNRPLHARIAEVDSVGVVKSLLDVKDAVVQSMAVTRRSVVAVLKRADQSSDVVIVSRRR